VSFWLALLFLYPVWFLNAFSKHYIDNLLSTLCVLPVFIVGLYFIVYYLIPVLLIKKKKYFFFFVSYIIVIISLAYSDVLINRFVFLPLFSPNYIPTYETYYLRLNHMYRVIVMTQSQVFIFISLKYLKNYIEGYFEKEKLKTKVAEAELNMLKSQIHPHFLFNTLNNIYTLSIEANNKQVSDSIEKLSELLRYSIYECKDKFTSLNKEIRIINNYIELEKLRYSNLDIEISFPEHHEIIYVIPLLYFTFVENAFKHGTSKLTKNKWLKLKLEITKDEVIFNIKNGKNKTLQPDPLKYSNGIGLKNAVKRLDLLLGKENYKLAINDLKDSFEVSLHHKILDNEGKVRNY
jgi:LytS/YehU family sensor histidine kinase